jgi:hypothetical protein
VDPVSFDPDGKSDEHQLSTEDLLEQILKELKKIGAHLGEITGEEIEDDDVC